MKQNYQGGANHLWNLVNNPQRKGGPEKRQQSADVKSDQEGEQTYSRYPVGPL